jgi:hypothetical protein
LTRRIPLDEEKMIGSLFAYLRNLIMKRSQAFTCCAGCEALPAPVGNRLCVSVTPLWEADAVLTTGWSAAELPAAVAAVRAAMPWLRRVHVPYGGMAASGRDVFLLPEGVGEADLHRVESLAEHFLALPPGRLPATPLLPVDFFTPNGLPLLFAAQGGSAEVPNFLPGPAGRTKSLGALFATACAVDPAPDDPRGAADYTLAFARWAYARRHGILAPGPFAE